MKHSLLILSMAFFSFSLTAQTLHNRTVFDTLRSESLGRDMPLRVCLPEDYSPRRQYEAVYVLDADYMFDTAAATLLYYSYCHVLPPVIVVAIDYAEEGDRAVIDMYLTDMSLSADGEKFYVYVNDELVPHINARYSVGAKNCIIGHSYTATYLLTYLYRNNPNFYSYLLMCPEQPESSRSSVSELQNGAAGKRVAVVAAEEDAGYRIEYADSLYRILNASKAHSSYFLLKGMGHRDMVPVGIAAGSKALFGDYLTINTMDGLSEKYPSAGALELYRKADSLNMENYGLPFERATGPLLYLALGTALQRDRDTLAARRILDIWLDGSNTVNHNGNFLEIAGDIYRILGDYDTAESFYRRSIDGYHRQGQDYCSWNVRRNYSLKILADVRRDYAAAWSLLDSCFEIFPLSSALLNYYKGHISASYGYRPEDGAECLRTAAENPAALEEAFVPLDRVYYDMAKCYSCSGDMEKATEMLRMAAELNPDIMPGENERIFPSLVQERIE